MSKPLPATVICHDIHGNEYEVAAEKLLWRPAAYGIVLLDGAVLLSKQFDGFDLPGGGVERGETPEDAVLREIKEETGIDADSPRLLRVETSFFKVPWAEDVFVQSLQVYYQCNFIGGTFSIEGFDEFEKIYAGMPEWRPINDLGDVRVAASYDWRKLIEQINHG